MTQPLSFIRDFVHRHRFQVAGTLLLNLAGNVILLLLPLLLGQAFAAMFGFHSARGRILGWAGGSFPGFMGLLAGVVFFGFILDYHRKRLHGVLSEKLVYDLRERLFRQHLQIEMKTYEEKGVGKFLLRFSGDLGSVQRFFSVGILQWTADLMLLLAGWVLMLWLHPGLGSLAAVLIGLLLTACKRIERQLENTEEQRRDKKSGMLAFVGSRLLAMASLKVLNRQTAELQRFDRRAGEIQQLGFRYAAQKAAFEALIAAGVYGIAAAVLVAVWHMKNNGLEFRADHTFALVLIVVSWRSLLRRVLGAGLLWRRGLISLRKISQLLSFPVETGAAEVSDYKDLAKITLRNVALRIDGRFVFRDLNFELAPGTLGCVTGRSGSGKTLLVKLLAGLYRPDSGELRLGGHDLEALHPRLLRKQMTFVSAAFPLYGKTILDAIASSRKPEHRQRAEAEFQHWQRLFPALKSMDLHAPLSENKERLSTGQSRILECLRACLTRKRILILDEPFSGLDHSSRRQLVELLFENTRRKAILLLTAQPEQLEQLDIRVSFTQPLSRPLVAKDIDRKTSDSGHAGAVLEV